MPPIGSRPFQVYNKGEARSLGCAEGSIRMKTGLVLEGGGMRGMFTAGVLDAFYARGLHFDGVIGVSAGAVFGVNFLSRQPGRVIRYNKRYIRDPRYMGPGPLLRTGNLFSPDFAYGTVPTELDPFDQQSFQASGVPFYAVVTNIETGHAEYPLIENVFEQMDTLRASASLPFVSRPVAVGDGLYLDGGIVDSIPFQAMRALGYDRLVVVLTRDGSYRKGPVVRKISCPAAAAPLPSRGLQSKSRPSAPAGAGRRRQGHPSPPPHRNGPVGTRPGGAAAGVRSRICRRSENRAVKKIPRFRSKLGAAESGELFYFT